MNKIFYWIVAIVVLGIIVVGLTRGKSATSNQSSSTTDKQAADTQSTNSTAPVVVFDGQTFTPSTLTITAGQTVTFTNNSSSMMWVASNPHPTHTDLAGFDAKQGMGKGQSYSFTFAKPGTFGYHNHDNARQGGTIIVH